MNYELIKGYLMAIIAGATFGMIPMFTIPVVANGMDYLSIIIYRFFFGCLGMLAMLLCRKVSLRISWRDFLCICVLSAMYIVSALCLFASYKYIASGVGTSLLYTDPIWCAIAGIIFLHQRPTWQLLAAMLLAIVGVAMLSGAFKSIADVSLMGLTFGIGAGITYGLYLFILPLMKISKMPALKLTFYVFFNAMVIALIYAFTIGDGLTQGTCTADWINLALLGLIPTAFSNICLTIALRAIDTNIVAILGAFEPLTAMLIGILLLNEPFDAYTIIGGILILVAIWVLILRR